MDYFYSRSWRQITEKGHRSLRHVESVARTFVAGKRLLFRPLTGTMDAAPPVGIASATKGLTEHLQRKILRNLAADICF